MIHPQPKPRPTVLTRADYKLQREQQERDCRKAVDARDKRICFWPGCNAWANEKHHIVPRSLGGRWVPRNILSACTLHHAYFKAGLVRVEGNPNAGPVTVRLTALGQREGVRLPRP